VFLPGVQGSAEFNRAYEAATATAPQIVIWAGRWLPTRASSKPVGGERCN
jgi:hypothetical protein